MSRAFARDEEGVIVGFGIFLFLLILMVGGIGVDVMHSEMKRTRLQHTLDRAVLAAADLEQTRDATEVVADYFDKSGMSDYAPDVTPSSDNLTYRTVAATAAQPHQTRFMKLVGVDQLDVNAASTAEERIGNVEISMVLDVSGSMGNNSKISNLRTAAKEFVQTMDDNTEDDTLTISIVPYASQVSVPDGVFEHMTVHGENTVSNCLNFEDDDFDESGMLATTAYDRTMHFTYSDNTYEYRDNNTVLTSSIDCKNMSSRDIAILQNDTTVLKNYIDGLTAAGNTSVEIGMKWGAALVDPDFRTVTESLVDQSEETDDGMVKKAFGDRPYNYGTNQSLKVVIVMSDGVNTRHHRITDGNREGDSPVWYNAQEEFYSIYLGQDTADDDNDNITEEPIYYWPSETKFVDHAYGEGTYEHTETTYDYECSSYRRNGSCKRYKKVATGTTTTVIDEPGSAEVVTYPDLWAYSSPKFVADDIFAPLLGQTAAREAWWYSVVEEYSSTAKDAHTKQICDAAKERGIVVFSIGFEAPDHARDVLKDCASSDAHYFDASGVEIKDSFAAIATSIRQLRLTQ
ncbi:TadE/TadG family type IV pilus assembly protein [Shimia sp. SK013]|uniref:TadE/TadG family type IV pilus assembly protein n=1 Tax=Shimia sp. SK013 TaxID=1389006 RepID=UPI0006B48BF6|nr:TadE/TadG family type IV pilus assembly protein [Shimia sp. SK013]